MNSIRTANRGQWSELYVLLKLLTEPKFSPAGDNLELIEGIFYPVSKIITNSDSNQKIIYTVSSDKEITIQKTQTPTTVVIKREVIKKYVDLFFSKINDRHENRGAFFIPEADDIMKILLRTSISATSYQKADLILEIYDSRLSRNIEHGYSIKSEVGGLSTLFNASRATNILYEIQGISPSQVTNINMLKSCRKRVEKIYELGGKMIYKRNDSQIFSDNLSFVDGSFSKILAESVLLFNLTEKRKVSDIVKILPLLDLNFENFEPTESFYEYNFKKFLFNSALGMVANKPWNQLIVAEGGIILVKRNGSLAGYNPESMNKFQEYLYKNTKFDTPSSRNEFGKIIEKNGNLFMKLNFQIRFLN